MSVRLRSTLFATGAVPVALLLGVLGSGTARADSDQEFAKSLSNPSLWPGMGHNLGLQRHSDLRDINTHNVANLQMTW